MPRPRFAPSWPEGAILIGFLGVLALIPLPDGNESRGTIGAFTVALGTLILLSGVRRGALFAGLSAVPAPVLQPLALLLLAGVAVAWQMGADPADEPGTAPVRMILCGAMFFLAFGLSQAAGGPQRLIAAIAAIAGVYAVLGLAIGALEWSEVVAAYRAAALGHVGGPFLGDQAFALFAGLGGACALAMTAWCGDAGRRRPALLWAGAAGFLCVVVGLADAAATAGMLALSGLIIVSRRPGRAAALTPLLLAGIAAAAWPALAGPLTRLGTLGDLAQLLVWLAFTPVLLVCLRGCAAPGETGLFARLGIAVAPFALIGAGAGDGIGAPAAIADFAVVMGVCGAVVLRGHRPEAASASENRHHAPLRASSAPQSGV